MDQPQQTPIAEINENQIITTGHKFTCTECKNEVDLSEKIYVTGDVVECPFCGIEYKIVRVTDDGEYVLETIEAEK